MIPAACDLVVYPDEHLEPIIFSEWLMAWWRVVKRMSIVEGVEAAKCLIPPANPAKV